MHFVIIGNGVASATAALTIRARDASAGITMIGGETEYFFSRTALMYAFMDRLSRRDLEPLERQVYSKQRIALVQDWVEDLDADARILRLRSGASLEYDRLLLATGSVPNRPDWKGLDAAREGVIHFVSMQDLDTCERLTARARRAVVVGGGLIGVELIECLRHHGREVTFLVREPWYWPAALAGDEGRMISGHIRRHGVDLRHDQQIDEVLVDNAGAVRAVRSGSGEEIACEMLGICIGVRPAIDWLRRVRTPPAVGRGIVVARNFSTSLENVWAAGDCAEISLEDQPSLVEQIWYSAKRQGELAALAMLGDAVSYRPPVFYNSAKFFDIEYTTVGVVNRVPEEAVQFYCRIPDREVSVRIVEHRGAVIGFNMLGSKWNHNFFEQWIAERRSLDYVTERLHQAQFDVEFGRQDLSYVRRARAQGVAS